MDSAVEKRLADIGERFGLTANSVLAAAAYELSRIRPECLWQALGRIAEGEAAELPATSAGMLPAPSKRVKRAIPA